VESTQNKTGWKAAYEDTHASSCLVLNFGETLMRFCGTTRMRPCRLAVGTLDYVIWGSPHAGNMITLKHVQPRPADGSFGQREMLAEQD
jgi:hypothetical protein